VSDRPSEFALIARLFAPLAVDPAALGLTDDVCLLKHQAGCDLLVTTDMLTEGVHFLAGDPPNLIAGKALRVNLSDLAAKGAKPVGYLLAIAVPRSREYAWLECFARGLSDDQERFGVSLLGGDTTATEGPLTLSVTALGHVPAGTMIRRSGARPGDGVYVSGTIGDAGAGLAVLQSRLGEALRGVATAALDVSDGLLADLGHIADVSKVRITVQADSIPRSDVLRRLWPDQDGIVRAATAGDDYEIAFTAASEGAAIEAGRKAGIAVTRIGWVGAGLGAVLVDSAGQEIPVKQPGFVHF
jgi:thiamine-monophosphate kinase